MYIKYKFIIFLNAFVLTIQESQITLDNGPKENALESDSARVVFNEIVGKIIPEAVGQALLQAFENKFDGNQIEAKEITKINRDMLSSKTGDNLGSVQITVERKKRKEKKSITTDKESFEKNEECPADL